MAIRGEMPNLLPELHRVQLERNRLHRLVSEMRDSLDWSLMMIEAYSGSEHFNAEDVEQLDTAVRLLNLTSDYQRTPGG